jgi:cell wall-associated NlpC family hydrolase
MRSSLRRALVGGAAVLLTATFAPHPAVAAPPLTVEEAKQQVDDLNTQAAAIDQDYAGVQDKIASGKKQLAQTQVDVKAQQAKVAALKKSVGQVALAQFQNSSLNTTAQLFLRSDTQTFLNQVSTVEKVNENQNSALQKLQTEQGNLASLERSAATDLTTLRADETNLAALRATSDAKVDAAKQILAKLTAEERARLAALEKARQKEAAAAAAEASAETETETATPATSTKSTGSSSDDDAPAAPSGSGKGATAVAFAKAQLGKPYSFGATGPNAYDCSGLTQAAWKAAGVSLSRTSQTQFGDGTPVSRDNLQPGDLVFFYPGITHVALYVGNGTVIHAPHAGSSVQYIKMAYMPFAGARRPG